MKIDGVIILDCTNLARDPETVNTVSSNFLSATSRPLGPMIVNDAVQSLNIPSTVINYVDFWDYDDLETFVGNWFERNNVTSGCFGISSLFDIKAAVSSGANIYNHITKLKKKYPTFKFILGGPAFSVSAEMQWLPDAIFSSNGSIFLFKKWLLGQEIDSKYCQLHSNGVPEYRTPAGISSLPANLLEDPAVPILHDDYCLTEQDALGFEIRKGCKFNCSFCSYEFRNAKNVNDVTLDKLSTFFSTAVNKYNITSYMVVDDTPNEEDSKLELMYDAVKDLPTPVRIAGFARLDLFAARPQQIDLCDKIGFNSFLFGVETLGTDAARKLIGKGGSKEKLFEVLKLFQTDYPDWYPFGSFMFGLPQDNPTDFWNGFSYALRNKLFKGVLLNPLYMYDIDRWHGTPTFLNSDFQLNAEKYGFVPDDEYGLIIKDGWNRREVEDSKIVIRANSLARKHRISEVLPFTAQILRALGWDPYADNFKNITDLMDDPQHHYNLIASLRDDKINKYIQNKLNTVL